MHNRFYPFWHPSNGADGGAPGAAGADDPAQVTDDPTPTDQTDPPETPPADPPPAHPAGDKPAQQAAEKQAPEKPAQPSADDPEKDKAADPEKETEPDPAQRITALETELRLTKLEAAAAMAGIPAEKIPFAIRMADPNEPDHTKAIAGLLAAVPELAGAVPTGTGSLGGQKRQSGKTEADTIRETIKANMY